MPPTAQISRNAPCPCGSGKKFKRCCGSLAAPDGAGPDGAQPPPAVASSAVDPPVHSAQQLHADAKRLYLSGKYQPALEQLAAILRSDARDSRALMGQALCLIQLGQLRRGLEKAEQAVQLRPDDLEGINDLVVTLFNLGKVEESLDWAQRAVKLGPEGAKTQVMVANCYEKLHRIDEALEANRLAQLANPGVEYLRLQEAKLRARAGDDERARDILLEVSRSNRLDPDLRRRAFSELGRVLDRLRSYDEAFDAFVQSGLQAARMPQAQKFKLEYRPSLINAYVKGLTAERLARWKPEDVRDDAWVPAFLVGFPRSGTTLTEQVLATHSAVQTTDEQPYVERVRYEWARLVGANLDLGWMADRLSLENILQLRKHYRETVEADLGGPVGTQTLIDKLPLNITNIGLINLVFPDARIIVALRDPRDCCLSAIMQDFELNSAMIHFLSLERAVNFYAHVMNAWLHFRGIVTLSHCEVRYEDTVGNLEREARRLATHLGLDWEPGIQQFHRAASERVISTPSYAAVTEPVHARAVGRWKNYRKYFEPLAPKLEPFIREFGYEP